VCSSDLPKTPKPHVHSIWSIIYNIEMIKRLIIIE